MSLDRSQRGNLARVYVDPITPPAPRERAGQDFCDAAQEDLCVPPMGLLWCAPCQVFFVSFVILL